MDSEDFERLLRTCRLRLDAKEREMVKKDINDIIDYFNTIEGVDCDRYTPYYHPVKIPQKKRADKVAPFADPASLLKNSKIYRFYVVGPKI